MYIVSMFTATMKGKDMELNSDLWYVKWFFWSCKVLDYFTRTGESRRWNGERSKTFAKNGTNLCQFVRTLFWGTSIYTLQFVVYALVVYVLVIKPFLLFSAASVLTLVGVVVGTIVGGIAVLGGAVWGLDVVSSKVKDLLSNRSEKEVNDTPTFLSVMWQYVVAQKRKICPMVAFTGVPIEEEPSFTKNYFENHFSSLIDSEDEENIEKTVNETETDGDKNETV